MIPARLKYKNQHIIRVSSCRGNFPQNFLIILHRLNNKEPPPPHKKRSHTPKWSHTPKNSTSPLKNENPHRPIDLQQVQMNLSRNTSLNTLAELAQGIFYSPVISIQGYLCLVAFCKLDRKNENSKEKKTTHY